MSKKGLNVSYHDWIASEVDLFHANCYDHLMLYSYIYGEGPFFFFVDDKLYELRPGDVVIVRSGIMHGGIKKIGAAYKRLRVHFPPGFTEFIYKTDAHMGEFLRDVNAVVVHPEGELFEEYKALIKEMRELEKIKQPSYNVLMMSCALRQLSILYRTFKDNTDSMVRNEDELVKRIISIVNSDYATLSSVADIARVLNYSSDYLSKHFRRHMNMGLHDFLTEKRLSVATAHLVSGKNVTDCAMECGFGSTSHFISVFKKRFGITPKQYVQKR